MSLEKTIFYIDDVDHHPIGYISENNIHLWGTGTAYGGSISAIIIDTSLRQGKTREHYLEVYKYIFPCVLSRRNNFIIELNTKEMTMFENYLKYTHNVTSFRNPKTTKEELYSRVELIRRITQRKNRIEKLLKEL